MRLDDSKLSRLPADLATEFRELDFLVQSAHRLNRSLELRRRLRIITEIVQEGLNCEAVSLLLHQEESTAPHYWGAEFLVDCLEVGFLFVIEFFLYIFEPGLILNFEVNITDFKFGIFFKGEIRKGFQGIIQGDVLTPHPWGWRTTIGTQIPR